MFTTNSCVGTFTPTLFAALTTEPLIVSTSVFLPAPRSAHIDVTPSGDFIETFSTSFVIFSIILKI